MAILRYLEEPQMTIAMEDSQDVIMKKCLPELERLQLRKEKRRGREREEGKERRRKTEFKYNK
jgi:hypothetical protein